MGLHGCGHTGDSNLYNQSTWRSRPTETLSDSLDLVCLLVVHRFVVKHFRLFSSRYKNLHAVVDQVFPPMDSFSASEAYSSFTFWRDEPPISDGLEDEMRQHAEEATRRQKSKGKVATTPTSGQSPKPTPTTALTKSNGEKVLTLAQATENTVKKP